LFVDSGTTLDFAVGSGSWHSEGLSLEKHLFLTQDSCFYKVRDRGADTTWSFSNKCKTIDSYMVDDQSGQCQFGADDHPQNCAKTVLLDFSTSDVQPKITGVWDVESAGDEWTGDNAFFYSFTMFCRKFDINVFDYGKFCEGKETGTFEDGNTVECNNDELGGGWIKVFELNDPLPTMGSAGPAIGNTPLWYS
jgi:hypothetical protein